MQHTPEPKRTYVGAVVGGGGTFGGEAGFYGVNLSLSAVSQLRSLITQAADPQARRRVTLTVTHDSPSRVKVTHTPPPTYEERADDGHVRGDAVRVTGKPQRSLNVDLTSRVGVGVFDELLARASARATAAVGVRVPSRSYDVVEVVADVDAGAPETAEQAGAGPTGAALAGDVWPADDFADWEGHGGAEGEAEDE